MGHLPASEENADFDPVTLFNKFKSVFKLKIEIMLFGFWSELNFLQMNHFLVLLCFVGTFALLVLILPVIHDPANRRFCAGCHFYQIQTKLFGLVYGVI